MSLINTLLTLALPILTTPGTDDEVMATQGQGPVSTEPSQLTRSGGNSSPAAVDYQDGRYTE